jgi:type I restriction-modification system DNA methylase subunit
LFNSILFRTPEIDKKYLSQNVLKYIYEAISQKDWDTGQLSLFDFRFDIIPTEFISHIYEVFLEGIQLDEGIYYTPNQLTGLIVDDTINKIGSVLDPACGSGMFLICSYRKMLELYQTEKQIQEKNTDDIIRKKSEIIKNHIFGIEKSNTGWRLAVFSLYLELLRNIKPKDIKKYIKQKLESDSDDPIFPYDFSNNILNINALEIDCEKRPFKDKTFDFIVGNPPFLEIKEDSDEINFINHYPKAKDIIGYNQISQAFMLKIKDWAKPDTRFGFIQNSSNFYNEKSENFRKFFFSTYQIENLYELSGVKSILFRKAKESIVITIFNNNPNENKDNIINYYPVESHVFSEQFKILIIQEDKKIKIKQEDLLNKRVELRDYLNGNEFDLELLNKLKRENILSDFLLQLPNAKNKISNGLTICAEEQICDEFNLSKTQYKALNKQEKDDFSEKFKAKYTRSHKELNFNVELIFPRNLSEFIIENVNCFAGDISKFHRKRIYNIFLGNKILYKRVGSNICAAFVNRKIYYDSQINSIFLNDGNLYYLICAILNSELVNYLINKYHRNRIDGSYPKTVHDAIENIPIPTEFDEDLKNEISEMSKQLSEGKLKYQGETKERLNKKIFDLYELNYLERQRIKDFLSDNEDIKKEDLEQYKSILKNVFKLRITPEPIIEYHLDKSFGLNFAVIAIYLNKSVNNRPSAEKTLKYIFKEISDNTGDLLFFLKEIIIGKDCIYILKSNKFQNWSKTKAYEDGINILKLICK